MLKHTVARRRWSTIGLLAILNTLLPVAILVFATGFFPYKPFIPGLARYDDHHEKIPALFDKVIFMVVDALRRSRKPDDFVYSEDSEFEFVHGLVRKGTAIPFTAHAAPPTITMPKVKALTTGSVPSFLDVILNFAESDTSSTLESQDTWLSQLKRKSDEKILIMYGDDTWLKLFPGTFTRHDGTSSFFVSDFTEVDHNVTRHIARELSNSDWNGMVLHYLGLDHIGHKSGPRSPHMHPKQREMDGIVHQIYEAMESQEHLKSTLFVLCGDHGMNDAGNHGGSAEGETSPALVLMSPKLQGPGHGLDCPSDAISGNFSYYDVVEQSDIAPTLAGLLGFPIPLNNLGVFIPRILDLWAEGNIQVELLYQNAQQLLRVLDATFNDFSKLTESPSKDCEYLNSEIDELKCLWAESSRLYRGLSIGPELQKAAILKFLRRAQAILSNAASSYEVEKLFGGLVITCALGLLAGYAAFVMQQSSDSTHIVCVVLAACYGTMMFASSFVEEEQQFWFWVGSWSLVWLYARSATCNPRKPWLTVWRFFALLISFRVLRRWNQTGQKHAGEADIGRVLLSEHSALLWSLVLLTLAITSRPSSSWVSLGIPRLFPTFIMAAISSTVLFFKLSFTMADAPELLQTLPNVLKISLSISSLVAQARGIFLSLATVASMLIVGTRGRDKKLVDTKGGLDQGTASSLHALFTLFLITQTRVNNIPVFIMFSVQVRVMDELCLQTDEISLMSIIFQYASFFAMGGSNAISSVDLSSAYNGVGGYNVIAVGLLTFFGNWAGPVWWASSTIMLLKRRDNRLDVLIRHLCLIALFTSVALAFTMAACTMMRTHLFIWTVFSPKYLYMIAWGLGQYLAIGVVLSSILWCVIV